jgi:hypothetical protein
VPGIMLQRPHAGRELTNEKPDRKDAAMNRHPAGSKGGLIGDPHNAAPL